MITLLSEMFITFAGVLVTLSGTLPYRTFILALSLTDWSCLLGIICSVALALRVDIVSPETFICCVCPSVPLSLCLEGESGGRA